MLTVMIGLDGEGVSRGENRKGKIEKRKSKSENEQPKGGVNSRELVVRSLESIVKYFAFIIA